MLQNYPLQRRFLRHIRLSYNRESSRTLLAMSHWWRQDREAHHFASPSWEACNTSSVHKLSNTKQRRSSLNVDVGQVSVSPRPLQSHRCGREHLGQHAVTDARCDHADLDGRGDGDERPGERPEDEQSDRGDHSEHVVSACDRRADWGGLRRMAADGWWTAPAHARYASEAAATSASLDRGAEIST